MFIFFQKYKNKIQLLNSFLKTFPYARYLVFLQIFLPMKNLALLIGCLLFSTVHAQLPEYYSNINLNLQGDALKNDLSTLITSTHTYDLIYTPDVWNVLKQADVAVNNPDKVMLLYGWNDTDLAKNNDLTRNRTASCHSSNCEDKWVREHVFPRSKGTPNLEFEGPGSDAHHLHAIDYDRNTLRSNFKFISNPTSYITYSRLIQQNGTDYFYPGDEWKGDVARMIMYMYVRYGNRCQPVNVGHGSTSYSFNGDMPNIFLQWNVEDPVSAHEINRNEKIAEAQGNRNPFIDNPYLATKIWNGPKAQDRWNVLSDDHLLFSKTTVYPTFTKDYLTIDTDLNDIVYQIFDSTGKLIVQNYTEKYINVSNYSSGFYLLNITANKQSKTYKFIKK